MGVIVDTGVFIAQEHATSEIDITGLDPDEDLFISAITASELLVGVHRANSSARRAKRLAFVESVLSTFPALPIDTEVARVHAQLLCEQLAAGLRSGAHDLLIAATALTRGYSVLTADVDDFSRVPGLKVLSAY